MEKECREGQQQHCGDDGPEPLRKAPFWAASEFLIDEAVVVEVLVGKAEPVLVADAIRQPDLSHAPHSGHAFALGETSSPQTGQRNDFRVALTASQ